MTLADRTLDTIHLPSHPPARQLARYLRTIATRIETDGPRTVEIAALLAARGWAGGTLGDGGARSTDTTTSVERAAGVDQDVLPADINIGRYADVDRDLAATLRLLWKTGLKIEELVVDLLAHADDIDELPAGSGTCVCCGRFVRPGVTGSENDRLKAGLCVGDYNAWARAGRPAKNPWIIERRQSMRAALDRGRSPAELLEREVG